MGEIKQLRDLIVILSVANFFLISIMVFRLSILKDKYGFKEDFLDSFTLGFMLFSVIIWVIGMVLAEPIINMYDKELEGYKLAVKQAFSLNKLEIDLKDKEINLLKAEVIELQKKPKKQTKKKKAKKTKTKKKKTKAVLMSVLDPRYKQSI